MRELLFTSVALAWLAACSTKPPQGEWDAMRPKEPSVVELRLDAPPSERAGFDLFSPPPPTARKAVFALRKMKEDKNVRGIFLILGPFGGAWGRASDIAAGLAKFRKTGRPVHCHFETLDNSAYGIASTACDRISMTPSGTLDFVGVAAQLFFAKALLDKIGLQADLLQMGRYKGAADPLTETTMPDETKENIGALVDDLHKHLIESVRVGRQLNPENIAAALAEGPLDSIRAKAHGLVDDVAFDDEARERLRKKAGVTKTHKILQRETPQGIKEILKAFRQGKNDTKGQARLAIVHISGNIVDGNTENFEGVTSGPYVRKLRKLADDPDVKGVVLRVNSPGGSALASDRIWHAAMKVRKKKPIVASIGDMAASGGYYIAAAANEIYSNPSSIVGSIGVVGGKISAASLTDKLGLNVETLQKAPNAAWASSVQTFSDSERAAVRNLLKSTYSRFVNRVATGRGIPESNVLAAAEGRVFVSSKALEYGLIDKVGSFQDALVRAQALAKVPSDVAIEVWPQEDVSLFEMLSRSPEAKLDLSTIRLPEPLNAAHQLNRLLGSEAVLAVMPFVLKVE